MSRIDAEYRALARRVAERLGKILGVHNIGVGGREKAGIPTGQLVVKVFLEKKRSLADLKPSEVIPREVEGMPTDVVETGPFIMSTAQGVPPFPVQEAYKQGDFGRYRPIKGGTQLGSKGGPPMPGTLGFMARVPADPKQIMAVTVFHALYPTGVFEVNRKCGQQNPEESSTKCCDNKIGLCVAGHFDADVDAAVVRVDGGQEWVAEIHQIGFIKGKHTISDAEATTLTYQVRKRGRTLRLTGGTVQSIVGTGTMTDPSGAMPPRPYNNAIIIKPNPSDISTNPWFQQEGDSGAALVNESNEVTGTVFGRNAQGWGIAQPIEDIINKFRIDDAITIEVATATRLGQVQTVPQAAAGDGSADSDFEIPPALRRLQRDLDRTEQGRELISVWLEHSRELNYLVHHEPRVAATWRRANGPDLFRLVINLVDAPSRPVPREIRGVASDHVLDEFLGEVERYASPGLRHDLNRHRPLLATLPGQSYDDLTKQLQ
jgi:hypothetical protein